MRMRDEGDRKNRFFRGRDSKPHDMVSDDEGNRFRYAGKVMNRVLDRASPKYSGHDGGRPYFKYIGNGRDRILLTEPAAGLLAARLRTPLQIDQHVTLASEEGFRVGEKPVTAEVVEAVLSRQLDDRWPKLTWHGYNIRALSGSSTRSPPRSSCGCVASWLPAEPVNSPTKC